MMTYEAQIVLRRDSPQQLADDVQAIAEFIERRKAASRERAPAGSRPRLQLVGADRVNA